MADLQPAPVLSAWRLKVGIVVGRIAGHPIVPDGATVSTCLVEIACDRS